MARYQWPGERDVHEEDDPKGRKQSAFDRLAALPGEIIAAASAARAALLALAVPETNVWLPIGPSVVIGGQAGSAPRVAGRIRDIAISDDGQRIYAAAANGGVWYSGDGGTNWSSLGGGASTPLGEAAAPGPNSLVTSCLHVTFGGNADGSLDVVYAGTGEIRPYNSGFPGSKSSGIGILKLSRPLPDALAHPEINPWRREATNLSGMGVFRIAVDPTNPDIVVAATSTGLWKRQGPFVEGGNWVRVTQGPFNFDADNSDKWCTDAVWLPAGGGVQKRLWIALVDDTLFSDTGVWFTQGGPDGPYEKVDLDDRLRRGRLGISAHRTNPSILYVLGKGPRLWRIDDKTARKVRNIPTKLFGRTEAKDQSDYDLAIAVHPTDPLQVTLGGSTVKSEQTVTMVNGKRQVADDGEWSASLFRLTITGTAAANNFSCNFNQDNQDFPGLDAATYIGNNVHADVHAIRYAGAPSGQHMWIGCDGGAYRSIQGGGAYTFIPRNNGLSVIEPGFVAGSPQNDGAVIIGTQDNGALRRIGDTIWDVWSYGDGGGVAYHPSLPSYYVGQYTSAVWSSTDSAFVPPVFRTRPADKSMENESAVAAFYSDLHVIAGNGANKARIALGTNRLWISEDWDPAFSATKMTWRTLPSGTDPRANGGTNTGQDTLDSDFGSIRVVLWAGKQNHIEDRIVALCVRAVVAYIRDPVTGNWSKSIISRYEEKCGDDEMDNDEIGENSSSVLPPRGAWSDMASHDPDRGQYGSLYVAATGYASFDDDTVVEATRMDTLWWFDGTNTWYPTRLRGHPNATRAPAYSVVVDPDSPAIVYVGTSAGVWKGTLTFAGAVPHWDWVIFSTGLPDAYIQDLAFFKSGDGAVKLLRAAAQARGVWEVDLSPAPTPSRRTYLRATPLDTRRAFPAILTDPFSISVPPRALTWYDSPDIKMRPAPGAPAPAAPSTPLSLTINSPGLPYSTWLIQTAMHATDPLVRPTGVWTQQFDARVKAYRAAHALPTPATAVVDDALWNFASGSGGFYANPWDGSEPTEADLHELIKNRLFLGGADFVIGVAHLPYKVDVLVHHRHFQPVDEIDVTVLLLRRRISKAEGDGAAVTLSAAWKNAVVQRLGGSSPALPDGWTAVGRASPTGPVSAMIPRAVTFDVNFTPKATFPNNSDWMFLAIVSAAPDPVNAAATLTGATIRDLVLNCHHVAARLITVRNF